MKKKNCSMGMQKTVVSLLFCAQHRSPNPLITPRRQEKKKTWKHVYTHTHTHTIQHNTTPKKLLVVRPLCVFIVFEDKVIPSHFYVLCTRRQRHTHTHTHTREHAQTHAPSTRFLTLEILLAVIYATHIHTLRNEYPLVSFLQQISQIPA